MAGEMAGHDGRRRRADATRRASTTSSPGGEEPTENAQYKILPILLSVLVDQDHVQDLLVELENSPMSIQVMDFELQRPIEPGHQAREGDQRQLRAAMAWAAWA